MAEDSGRFLNVFMDQNNKCNLRCIMCGFSDPRARRIRKYDMPFRLFEKIAQEVFPSAKYLALSCLTEPLMTRDFPERLDLLKTYTVPFTEVVTNGTLLREPIIDKMIDARISRIAISLDGASPAVYESIRQGARFDKVVANVRKLNSIKKEKKSDLPLLRVNHVLSAANIGEFDAFLELAESLEVRAIDVRTVLPCQNARYQGREDDSFLRRVEQARDKLRLWTQENGVEDVGYLRRPDEIFQLRDQSGEKVTCRRPWDTTAIHPNGDVFPCITWYRRGGGNMARHSFEAVWNSPAYEAIRKEFEERKPEIDCLYCTIRKAEDEDKDDWFLAMLKKRPPSGRNWKAVIESIGRMFR